MNKELFVKVAFEDLSLLIDNYLSNGMVSSYNRWEDIEGFIYEKFPCLSVAFLMRTNCSKDDYDAFLSRYNQQISSEVEMLKKSLLTDVDVEILSFKKRIDELTTERIELQELYKRISLEKAELTDQLNRFHDENAKLKEIISLLENNHTPIPILTKEQIVAIWSNYYSLPYINDNAIFDRTNFDIERFIEDLTTKFSISITSEELLENNSLTKVIDLLQNKQACYKEEFNKLLKQYPQKKETIKELNANNVTQIILSCCPKKNGTVPKYVFGTDTLKKAQLNVEKLYSILYYNFGLNESTLDSIRSVKNIDELKEKILSWQLKVTINSATLKISKIAKSIEEKTKEISKEIFKPPFFK